jgi:hypothetical protein
MRVHRGLLAWGLFFIVLGLVPLAVRGGFVDEETVRRAWQLWPLILIGIGLGLVLQRTQLASIGALLVAVTVGLMAGSVIAVGFTGNLGGFNGCSLGGGNGVAFEDHGGELAPGASVSLDLNCGELTATTAGGTSWSLTGSDGNGRGPDVEQSPDRVQIRSPERGGFGFGQSGERWTLTLPRDAQAMTLDVSANAGSATLDLAGLQVTNLDMSVNAGSATIDASQGGLDRIDASANGGSLGISFPARNASGSLSANAGSVSVCVPDGVGLRIKTGDQALSGNNFADRGLEQDGSTWTSPGFDGAAAKIDLSVSANLGAVNLNPEGGCD